MKKFKYILFSLTALFSFNVITHNASAKEYNQKVSAMGIIQNPHEVNNHIYPNHDHANDSRANVSESLKTIRGNQHINFKNNTKLTDAIYGASIGTIQNITATPDGKYMFVEYHRPSANDDSMDGQIVRFNIKHPNYQKKSRIMKIGHGQSLAYNPVNHKLYMIILGRASAYHAKLIEFNPWSLKAIRTTKIHSKTYLISDQLIFDKHGKAYSYTKSYSPQSGKNSLRIYKGIIGKHRIRFDLIQTIRHAPGANDEKANIPQSLAYNHKHNRIYFVSNGEIISAPVNRLGHLKKQHIKATVFKTNDEFEGLTFTNNGKPYLATRYQIFSANHTF